MLQKRPFSLHKLMTITVELTLETCLRHTVSSHGRMRTRGRRQRQSPTYLKETYMYEKRTIADFGDFVLIAPASGRLYVCLRVNV